jgi:hypothetical protein
VDKIEHRERETIMAARVHKQQQRRQKAPEPEKQNEAQRSRGELDEEVACCLAEIDEALAAAETDAQKAKREWEALDWKDPEVRQAVSIWAEKWKHTGCVGWCCGTPRYRAPQ